MPLALTVAFVRYRSRCNDPILKINYSLYLRQPEFGGWAYNLKRGAQCVECWERIPTETELLVTHGPPAGHGDLCRGGVRAG